MAAALPGAMEEPEEGTGRVCGLGGVKRAGASQVGGQGGRGRRRRTKLACVAPGTFPVSALSLPDPALDRVGTMPPLRAIPQG